MAICVHYDFAGGTLEQYDQVAQRMGFRPGGVGSPGMLFHWITKTGEGIRVTDVWEIRERCEQFFQERAGPAIAEVGVPGPPKITFFEVHNYLTKGGSIIGCYPS